MKIENIQFRKNNCGGWLVIGDTERFGKNEILFESYKFEDCLEYLAQFGYTYTLEDAMETVTKIQIGARMFHRIHRESNGKWMGYSNKWGWEVLDIAGFTLTEPHKAKRTVERRWGTCHDTMKLGNACTW